MRWIEKKWKFWRALRKINQYAEPLVLWGDLTGPRLCKVHPVSNRNHISSLSNICSPCPCSFPASSSWSWKVNFSLVIKTLRKSSLPSCVLEINGVSPFHFFLFHSQVWKRASVVRNWPLQAKAGTAELKLELLKQWRKRHCWCQACTSQKSTVTYLISYEFMAEVWPGEAIN